MAQILCFQRPALNSAQRSPAGTGPSTTSVGPAVAPTLTAQPVLVGDVTSQVVSAHPDALRRRQQAAARKAAAQAQAELVNKASWWEGAGPPNLQMLESPGKLHEAIAAAGGLVVVDFFTSWCTACRRLYPKLKQIAENNPDVIFIKVNAGTDALREMAEAMNVTQLPFFHFYRGGELVTKFAANLTRVNRLRAEIAANKDCNPNDACMV